MIPAGTIIRSDLIRRVRRLLPRTIAAKMPRRVVMVRVSEEESRRLNRQYRRKNKPANVLSFRYGDEYGEIILCPWIIRRDAALYGNSYQYQLTWMIVHGMIHLAGLHHEESSVKAAEALSIEQQILKKIRGTKSHSGT